MENDSREKIPGKSVVDQVADGIISRIIDRVDMHTGYDIKITLNISIEQFLNTIEMVA